MTFRELLAGMFVVAVAAMAYHSVSHAFGFWPGVGAVILAEGTCIAILSLVWRILNRRDLLRRGKLRENYRGIYRVLGVPTDRRNVRKPERAEIRLGDYGWEAEPVRQNGLIYLQGLSKEWYVVWWAGFAPYQIEYVAPKPISQYDWPQFIREKTQCPFPVQRSEPCIARGHPN